MDSGYNVRANLTKLINKCLRTLGVEVKACALLPTRNLLGLRSIQPKTILDVGANTGQFVLELKPIFPSAKFFSFEPLPSCFELLKKLSLSDSKWECFNLALGDVNKVAEFHIHTGHTSSSSFLSTVETNYELYPETRKQETALVQCATLDEWIRSHPEAEKNPIVLKLDVQGYETKVLRGAETTLPNVEAVITEVIVETLYEAQSLFSEQVELLAQAGLNFTGVIRHAFDPKGNVISFDGVFRRARKK